MTWWTRPGPRRFCDQKAGAALAEKILGWDAHSGVRHLAVRRPAASTVTEYRHRFDRNTLRVGGNDDLAHPSPRLGVRLRHGHHDPKGGALRTGREPLVAVDHPLVAVEHRRRAQTRRIRAGNVRLGHREERP